MINETITNAKARMTKALEDLRLELARCALAGHCGILITPGRLLRRAHTTEPGGDARNA